MKKVIVTLFAVTFVSSVFAFNFDDGKFLVNTELKKEISNQIVISFNDNLQIKSSRKQKQEPELLLLIRTKMDETMQRIRKYTSFRKNVMTNAFIEVQKNQKIAYEQMAYWDVPVQIFVYIKKNFDLDQIQHANVTCKYTKETAIEVYFRYKSKNVHVVYTYNPEYQFGDAVPIRHSIS